MEEGGDTSTQQGKTRSTVQLKADLSHNVIIHPGKEGPLSWDGPPCEEKENKLILGQFNG
jgi:hypothetical protein